MSGQHEYIFFTDRDLGKQFPDILKKAGIRVERHVDHFADDADDEEWLKEISKRGWYVLTHDQRIRYKPNEIAAVKNFKIGLFVIIGKAPFAELAQNFVLTYPKLIRFMRINSRPFIAKVYRPVKATRKVELASPGYVKLWVSF